MNVIKLMALELAICVATASSPSLAADIEITADTSLAADTTADALVVSPGATRANCRHWTCYGNGGTDGTTGLTKSTVATWVVKGMDIGTYAMVMRTHANGRDAYADQTINIASPGKYRLRFTYMACNGSQDRRGGTFLVRLFKGGVTNTIRRNCDLHQMTAKVSHTQS